MLKFKNISTGLLCSYIGNRSKYFGSIINVGVASQDGTLHPTFFVEAENKSRA